MMNTPRALGVVSKRCASLAALSLSVMLSGCERPGKVERSILREIRHSCKGADPCSIRIRNFTPFDWDRAFFFSDATSELDRSRALGTSEEGYTEFEDQLVFLKNGRIVYQESEPTNIEKPTKDGIAFAGPESKNFTTFSVNTVFAVSTEEGPDGEWFLLTQTP